MKVMEHDAVIDLIWKTLEGDCTPAEQASVQALIAEDEVWEAVYLGLVALYQEGGHIALVDKRLGVGRGEVEAVQDAATVVRPPLTRHVPAMSERRHYTLMSVMGMIVMALLFVSFQNLLSNRVRDIERPAQSMIAMAKPSMAP